MAQLQRLAIAPEQLNQSCITLDAEQAHYLRRVLRLAEGDRFIAMNGQGQWWLAELQGDQPQAQVLESLSIQTELPVPVTLMVAPAKGRGFDEVVRCSTELGVTCVVPLLSERTLVHPSLHKLERWRRIAKEAAEQCQRQVIPEIRAPLPLPQALQWGQSALGSHQAQYICVTTSNAPNLWCCLDPLLPAGITVMTGPEGGWSSAERDQAVTAGVQPVSLGRRVLRAVTAPLSALSVISTHLELVVDREEIAL